MNFHLREQEGAQMAILEMLGSEGPMTKKEIQDTIVGYMPDYMAVARDSVENALSELTGKRFVRYDGQQYSITDSGQKHFQKKTGGNHESRAVRARRVPVGILQEVA